LTDIHNGRTDEQAQRQRCHINVELSACRGAMNTNDWVPETLNTQHQLL